MLRVGDEELNGDGKAFNDGGKVVGPKELCVVKGRPWNVNDNGEALKGNGDELKCDGYACEEKALKMRESR